MSSASNPPSRTEYNREWRKRNRSRTTSYNRTQLDKGRSRFKTGESQRATEKRCPLCETVKPAAQFYLSNTNKDGLHGWCKECSDRRTVENERKRLFGVTPEVFEAMSTGQEGKCGICKTVPSETFHVDHCHQTGRVRALLCRRCNLLIGSVDDSPQLLQTAIAYLTRFVP